MELEQEKQFVIDAAFPGGNIIIDCIDGDTIRLRQDRSTSSEWWFHWAFHVRGVADRKLRFQFTDGDVFTAGGPCFSRDGEKWEWLGRDRVRDNGFEFEFSPDCDEAFFALGIPYLERHLRQFLITRPSIQQSVLVTSEHGRPVELLTLQSKQSRWVVPVTARSHACEATAGYVLEGIMDFWLNDQTEGVFLRENVDLRVVPFIDKDGVEEGKQGKCTLPHDHNRDCIDEPIYVATPALMALFAECAPRMPMYFDVHCPWIRGGRNEEIFIVGVPEPWQTRLSRFTSLLEKFQTGPLRYSRANDIPAGEEWNKDPVGTLNRYVREHCSVEFACSVEFPYALSGGQLVTEEGGRGFGADLARAIALALV